jgi:hypothetical protein
MFEQFPKIARLSRDCVVTEKIDGTNAQVHIVSDYECASVEVPRDCLIALDAAGRRAMYAGSRSRYITPTDDNFGFAAWVKANADALWALGEGRHYGEWWGSGIQRGYGLQKGEKRFSLFNVARWAINREDREKYPTDAPECCSVVPVLYSGEFSTEGVNSAINYLRTHGSVASKGFMQPEGVVVWHEAARQLFKKTLDKDEEGKEQKARRLAHAG